MPARTYATDVYLACPCSECDGREVTVRPPEAIGFLFLVVDLGVAYSRTVCLSAADPAEPRAVVLHLGLGQRLGPSARGGVERSTGADAVVRLPAWIAL